MVSCKCFTLILASFVLLHKDFAVIAQTTSGDNLSQDETTIAQTTPGDNLSQDETTTGQGNTVETTNTIENSGNEPTTNEETTSSITTSNPNPTTGSPEQPPEETTVASTQSAVDANITRCPNGTYGYPECYDVCGGGCPTDDAGYPVCNDDGSCMFGQGTRTCSEGYTGQDCSTPICSMDCNGGECLAPNSCQNCPIHFSSGETCRNIRLDGFLRGSLPTFAILTGVVVLLSVSSKWYVRRKVQQKAPQI